MGFMLKCSNRLIIGVLSILFIIFLWISKDVSFSLGMLATNLLVTGIKIVGITGIVLFLKKVLKKLK